MSERPHQVLFDSFLLIPDGSTYILPRTSYLTTADPRQTTLSTIRQYRQPLCRIRVYTSATMLLVSPIPLYCMPTGGMLGMSGRDVMQPGTSWLNAGDERTLRVCQMQCVEAQRVCLPASVQDGLPGYPGRARIRNIMRGGDGSQGKR